MADLFIFLFFVTLIGLIVGLIKPSIIIRISRREFTRKQISIFFTGALILFFILIGLTAPYLIIAFVLTFFPNFILLFLIGLIPAIVLWFLFKIFLKNLNTYKGLFFCCILSLIIIYNASFNIVGYNLTMDYLTKLNNQIIQKTGQGITLQEENNYKEYLFQNKEFQTTMLKSSIVMSFFPFIFSVFSILFLFRRSKINKS